MPHVTDEHRRRFREDGYFILERAIPGRYAGRMSDVTQILKQIEQGDREASEELLPLVYAELRRLAAAKLANEKPGQTLQATALVHEAYLRLVKIDEQKWNGRAHFFGAAAEAMRSASAPRQRSRAAEARRPASSGPSRATSTRPDRRAK